MQFEPIEIKDKLGRTVILRSAEVSDAERLIAYLKTTAGETPYLIREPEEVTFTLEEESAIIEKMLKNPKALMLVAEIDGEHVGNCSVAGVSGRTRLLHRCSVGIAIYQKYCGLGIGRKMMEAILTVAKEMGYEQVELEVVKDNEAALELYKALGFEVYGLQPNGMKYQDGTYADLLWMMKKL